jgi:hypothetical protein
VKPNIPLIVAEHYCYQSLSALMFNITSCRTDLLDQINNFNHIQLLIYVNSILNFEILYESLQPILGLRFTLRMHIELTNNN